MAQQFGAKLRHLRSLRHLGQRELATIVNASKSHVSNMEAGRKAPSLAMVVRIAVVFEVTTDYLLRDDVPVASPIATQFNPDSVATSPSLLGSKLRVLRTQQNWLQADVAQHIGLRTQGHISLLESSGKEPSLPRLLQLADLFGVSLDDLLRDDIAPEEIRHEQ